MRSLSDPDAMMDKHSPATDARAVTRSPEGSPVSNSGPVDLAFLVPVALLIVLIAVAWQFILVGISAIAFWLAWRHLQRKKRQKQALLKEVFYQLVQENQGYVTPLDLAVKADISGDEAQSYLQECAREFSADLEVSDRGNLIYFFSTAQTTAFEAQFPPLSQSEFESTIDRQLAELKTRAPSTSTALKPLIQSELAKRLSVHPSTISKKKLNPDFPQWSCAQDPEGIAWEYAAETKLFSPGSKRDR